MPYIRGIMDPKIKADALAAIEAKRKQLIAEQQEIGKKINDLMERGREIGQELTDCDAAARVFGLEVPETAPISPAFQQHPAVKGARAYSVRDLVLEQIAGAYPRPCQAKDIRDWIERTYDTTIHWKTVGMTLYRLSKDGLARRDGHNWFFVPREAETKNPGELPPGSESLFE